MALGLNIVVGFAGLLDLGYVAFFAIGAFVIGWLGSQQFPDVSGGDGLHFLTPDKSPLGGVIPGIHINFFLVIFIAAAFTALWGVILGAADAAPARRLPGDRHARLRRDRRRASSRTRRAASSGSARRTSPTAARASRRSTRSTGLGATRRSRIRWSSNRSTTSALGMVLFTDLPQHPAARLAARAGLDRGPRGRGRGRVDGRQPVGRSSRPTRSAPRSAASPARSSATYNNTVNVDQFEFGFSVFILCMVVIGGMGNIWGVILGAIFLSMLNRFLLPELNTFRQARARLRRHLDQLRDLRLPAARR